mmetsp:Transcript_27924/g.54413  ORF Transcript_27924/g.54413 Transcript_27924/m.54413 type:complete len:225 (+) Transcript_27924:510-1184(+)
MAKPNATGAAASLAALGAVGGGMWALYRLMHPRSTRWFDTKGKTIIKPLAHEIDDEHLQYYPSTTTVTHFSLKGSVRIEEVIERLRLRTKAIISKNPWLASRLVVVKGQTVMAHPAEVKDFDLGTYFQCLDHIDPKFESLSMDSGRVKLEDYLRVVPLVEAGKGIQLLEKDLPETQHESSIFWKVAVPSALAPETLATRSLDFIPQKPGRYGLDQTICANEHRR